MRPASGPVPPWLQEESDETITKWVYENASQQLAGVLESRLAEVRTADPSALLRNARKELGACVADRDDGATFMLLALIEELETLMRSTGVL